MTGCWVIVCGPSGAGKDSVLAWAREALRADPRIRFARRLVTRPSEAGSEHEEVSMERLDALRARGGLAWHWTANGHGYGVPAEYRAQVDSGAIVVVNGSREHARQVAGRADVRCVLLTAPSEFLRARLLQRAREDAAQVALRMARNETLAMPVADRVIANGGPLHGAGAALRDYLLELAR